MATNEKAASKTSTDEVTEAEKVKKAEEYADEKAASKTSTDEVTEAEKVKKAEEYADSLVKKARVAADKFGSFTQEQVDKIVGAMAFAAANHALELAKEAVEETGRGVVEDKDIKNHFASETVYNTIRHDKTVGVIKEDTVAGMIQIAAPLGVLAAIIPTTNPTSTTIFKALISAKTRNTVIFAFHPQAQKCSAHAAQIVYEAGLAVGAPKDFIQWIEIPALENTTALIKNSGISTIIATGGPGMVNAALSSGNPSLGVGPGNGAIFIDSTARIDRAVADILLSKRFDNGMICACESSVVIAEEIYDEFLEMLQAQGSYLVPKKEHKKVADFVFVKRGDGYGVVGAVPGKTGNWIGEQAGIHVPEGKDVLLFELEKEAIGEALSSEKLSPLLSIYKAGSRAEGIEIVQRLLDYQGGGHNAGLQIGTQEDPFVKEFGEAIGAVRILVNQPDTLGAIGDIYTDALRPSLTLGTGSWGKNSLSHNLTTYDLLNIKTVAKRRNRPQWVRLPKEIYYEKESISFLQEMPNMHRVFIVADPGMVKFGFVNKVVDQLELRPEAVVTTIYGTVQPNPPLSQAIEMARLMADFQPDVVLAIGGGSSMDGAKVARLIYEYSLLNEVDIHSLDSLRGLFAELAQKFIDIRKRIIKYHPSTQTQLVCVPTTSGTGSEVTPFAVITDDYDPSHIKYPLTDYQLTPNISIVDPEFVMTVPKRTIAWSGLDVLSHAMEAYVSVMTSDFTKPWSLRAIKLVFENLEKSYRYDPSKPTWDGQLARENMHNAATLAGMAFANALLGINHSIAHKTGGEFNLPHGLAISIAMPHVIRFNSATGNVKHTPYPKYEVIEAQKNYADIARFMDFPGETDEELVESLIKEIKKLTDAVDIDTTLSGNGVSKEAFDKALDKMASLIYDDQCTPANPRQPEVDELKQLLIDQF